MQCDILRRELWGKNQQQNTGFKSNGSLQLIFGKTCPGHVNAFSSWEIVKHLKLVFIMALI